MNNQMIPIGKLFDIEKGELQSTKCTPGDYDFITAAEDWKTHNEYTHECEALIFAAAASGSLGRTHYVDGKFTTSDLCYILTPKNDEKYPLNLSFYHFVFNSLRPSLVAATKSGTSKESINQTNFKNYEIPYFDIELQDFWIEKLKNTLGLKGLLGSELTQQQTLLKKLRQQILQEAIEGKLTANWRAQNPDVEPASELLKRIAAEKAQLVKEKKIKAQKPFRPITDEEKPFELPQGWEWCRFQDVAEICSNLVNPYDYYELPHIAPNHIEKNTGRLLTYQSAREDEVISGKHLFYPGQLLYSKVRPQLNKVAFAPCEGLCSADMYPIEAYIVPSYLQKVMLSQHFLNEVNRFDNRVKMPKINQNQLSSIIIPCPPFNEQQAIVTKVEKLFALCDQLEIQINHNQTHAEQLMQAVLKEAFSHNSESEPSAKKSTVSADAPEVIRA